MLNHSIRLWRYFRQNSSFYMQNCCFQLMLVFTIQSLTYIIQHWAFTMHHSHFKIQYSTYLIQHCASIDNSTSIFQNTIHMWHSCFISSQNERPYFKSTFLLMSRWHQKPREGLDCGNRPFNTICLMRTDMSFLPGFSKWFEVAGELKWVSGTGGRRSPPEARGLGRLGPQRGTGAGPGGEAPGSKTDLRFLR